MRYLILLLLSVVLSGQGARVTLFDGTQLLVEGEGSSTQGIAKLSVIQYSPGFWRVEVLNTGAPRWIVGKRVDGEDLFLSEVLISCPDTHILKNSAKRQIDVPLPFKHPVTGEMHTLYAALHSNDPQQRRDPHPMVQQSKVDHYLEGGTALVWDLVPAASPGYPLPQGNTDAARAWLGIVEDVEVPSRLARLRSLMTASPKSLEFASTERDLGWLLYHWTTRFAGNRRVDNTGPYAWPGLVWADFHSNLDYSPETDCFRQFLATGDRFAWELGYELLLHKVSQGMYRTDAAVNVKDRWAYEKSSVGGRAGDFRFPEPSHEWDEGLLIAANLSGDPWLLEAAAKRRKACLQIALPNTRNGGARRPGWLLRCLRAHMTFTPGVDLLSKAGNIVQSQFAAIKPTETFIKNDYAGSVSHDVDPWQEALLYGEVLRWHQDFGLPLPPRFDELCRWNIKMGTSIRQTAVGPALEGHYTQHSKTGAYTAPWPSTAAFWLPLLHHYRAEYPEHYEACKIAAFGLLFQGWNGFNPVPPREAQIDCSGYGSAGRKTFSQVLRMAEDRYL